MTQAAPLIHTTQKTIVIDPGHGGKDTGLTSPSGIREKNITLKLARQVAQRLEDHYNIILTRSEDRDVQIDQRVFSANLSQADLFVSIHLSNQRQHACFAYFFNPPLPDSNFQENLGQWKSTPARFKNQSKKMAQTFFEVFSTNQPSIQCYVSGAPVLITEGLLMPAVLIEPLSAWNLPQHQEQTDKITQKYADLIAKSIHSYFISQ